MKEKLKKIISMFLSVVLIFFIWHKFLTGGNTSIFIMLVFPIYYFLNKVVENENKRKFTISIIIAIIFAIIELICSSINKDYTLNHILDKWIILNFLGYTILAWSTVSSIYTVFEKYKISSYKEITINKLLSDSNLTFVINAILILLAWIPYFLRYYPGLLTADSCVQVEQAIGLSQLSNHHPVLHTTIVAIFVNLGQLVFKDINIGIAFFTIFQMITMSVFFSFVLRYMSKKKVPVIIRLISLLYYMFYPVNALFSVTMWKDVLFAGIIPIYIIQLMELIFSPEEYLTNVKSIIKYVVISLLVMFLRNNGTYIVLLVLPFIVIILKKHWKKIIPISCLILLSYFIIKTCVFNVFNVQERFC